jgi:ubiquitin carboxyl-terminal hydrolase L5
MATYEEDQIEFSILSLVKDPIMDLTTELALNVKSLLAINGQLANMGITVTELNSPNCDASSSYDATIQGPNLAFDLTREAIDRINIPEDVITMCKSGTSDELGIYRQKLMRSQKDIRASIKEEQQARRADEDHAAGRRHDYGPAVHTWAGILARKKMFHELLTAT